MSSHSRGKPQLKNPAADKWRRNALVDGSINFRSSLNASTERLPSLVDPNKPLRIAQFNFKRSYERLSTLLDRAHSPDGRYDIIFGQDPPPSLPWVSAGEYAIVYGASRTVLEEDNPGFETRRKKKGKKKGRPKKTPQPAPPDASTEKQPQRPKLELDGVFFMVHRSIDPTDWYMHRHETQPEYIATLELNTPAGTIAFTNVLNRNCQVDVRSIFDSQFETKATILLGDFNLHHPSWSGPTDARDDGKELHLLTRRANMKLLNTPGEVTWSRGPGGGPGAKSTIDLAFAGHAVQSRFVTWKTVSDVFRQNSDHMLVEMEFRIESPRKVWQRIAWHLANNKHVQAVLKGHTKELDKIDMQDPTLSSIDDYTDCLARACQLTVQEALPVVEQRSLWVDFEQIQEVKEARDQARRARAAMLLSQSEREIQELQAEAARFDALSEKLIKQHRREMSEKMILEASKSRRKKGLFGIPRKGRVWCLPREQPHMPNLQSGKKDRNGKEIFLKTGQQKEDAMREGIWLKKTSNTQAEQVEDPGLQHNAAELGDPKLQGLEENEVWKLIKKLDDGKAAGDDQIPNEFIKMNAKLLEPYLTCLFSACLKKSYQPRHFRRAKTIVLKKADKPTYDQARSWRPIALLSTIGKLLESIVAQRLNSLNKDFKLLPQTQCGVAGKSTADAIRTLLDPVYQAWARKNVQWVASLLSLDQKGAFDRVNRSVLVRRLASVGIPRWIVKYVVSFLSDRMTDLHLPGHGGRAHFFVNMGIPQGSPLSPILFLFFAAPILKKTAKQHSINQTVVLAAYVDDAYILVCSQSYKRNCEIIKSIHDDIMAWAEEDGVEFEPSKYAVMHFRKPGTHQKITPVCKLLPAIDNIGSVKDVVKEEMRILGVIVDHQLKWVAHAQFIRSKVDAKLRHFAKFSRMTSGPDLSKMRLLYISNIRSIITYACAAWFIRGKTDNKNKNDTDNNDEDNQVKFPISGKAISILRRIQYQSLLKISGSISSVAQTLLEKEMAIDPIEVTLERMATKARVKALNNGVAWHRPDGFNPARRDVFRKPKPKNFIPSPYRQLDEVAEQVYQGAKREYERSPRSHYTSWNDQEKGPKIRNDAIDSYCRQKALNRSQEIWETYCKGKGAKKGRPTQDSDWSEELPSCYDGLTRAQCSILLQCRTGAIGLNQYLHFIKLRTTPYCDCPGQKYQNAKHLFTECPILDVPRNFLASWTMTTNFHTLMNEPDLAKFVATWAIMFFPIAAYTGRRVKVNTKIFPGIEHCDFWQAFRQWSLDRGKGPKAISDEVL